MPRENDKEPVKEPSKEDKTVLVLRKGNVKKYTCPWCGKDYPDRQGLHYHLTQSATPCREKQDAKDSEPPGTQETTDEDSKPRLCLSCGTPLEADADPNFLYCIKCASQEEEVPPKLDGETPPIPMILVYIFIAVCALLVGVLVFWDVLYKFYRKHTGGEVHAGTGQ